MGSRQNIQGKEWAKGGVSTDPGAVKIDLGYIAEKPPYQTENFVKNRADQQLAHIEEYGIPTWLAATEYVTGSLAVGSDGIVYRSILVATNQGNNPVPTPGSNWIKAYVDLDTTETITGLKTLDALKLGGNQDANNNKIINLAPPTLNQDAVSKTYADGLDTANSVTDQAYADGVGATKVSKDGSTAYSGTGAGFKDDDTMADNADDATASQQSIKAYVDNKSSFTLSGAAASKTTMTGIAIFEDLDLSAIVGSSAALCFIRLRQTSGGLTGNIYKIKPKGDPGNYVDYQNAANDTGGVAVVDFNGQDRYVNFVCSTDANGFMQIGSNSNAYTHEFVVVGFVK